MAMRRNVNQEPPVASEGERLRKIQQRKEQQKQKISEAVEEARRFMVQGKPEVSYRVEICRNRF
jgi:hypothetical protein